jgi:hypothetical protein
MSRASMGSTLSPSLLLRRRILAAILVALALALAAATGADAAIVTARDTQGRTITFDVRAATVDTDWYAAVLRGTAHGNEISDVTIRIVPEPDIEALCGDAAAACYSGRNGPKVIFIPAGKNLNLESTLIHEYGHHLDTYWHVARVPELNGTPAWWQARGMASLLSRDRVAFDYSLGWDHGIAEIFAEDYAYIHMGDTNGGRYGIPWLSPPDEALKTAMFAELGTPTAPLPEAPNEPLVIERKGVLAPRDTRALAFGLLGPGRRVTFTAKVSRPKRKGVRARVQVICDGRVVATQPIGKGRSKRTVDVPNLGPAQCDARLVSRVGVSLAYTLTLRLAIESA